MAHVIEDRVQETSTTTGTGAFTLAGAVTGFRAFSAVCSTSDTVPYIIEEVDANGVPDGDWETGIGTYSAANTLTRTTVLASSNAGAAVNWAAGDKRVAIGPVADRTFKWTQIATASPSGVSAVDFTSIPQTYSDLRLEIEIQHNSGISQGVLLDLHDGTSWAGAVPITSMPAAAATDMTGGVFIPGYTGDRGILCPSVEAIGASPALGDGNNGNFFYITPWRITGGIDGIRIAASGGNITGTITLYGR